ncbi:MAG: AGE family epimerase/isomerase [Candidatus Heimdallarchaeota archaeon]
MYKDAQSQAFVISALIAAFDQFGAEIYLERAHQTVEFALTYLWDKNNTGFYVYSTANGTVPIDGRLKRTVTQALMIRALSEMYHKINDKRYLDYINKTISFSLSHLRDPNNGGFFAHTSEDGLIVDETMSKASSKQFYMILALLEAFKVYRELSHNTEVPGAFEYANYLFRIILETLEFVIKHFWDVEYKGFYIAHDMMGEIQNTNKFAIPQALGVEILLKTLNTGNSVVTNLQWHPITPTPLDKITISVSAFGLSPIECVILRYNLNDNMATQSILMEPTQAAYTYEAEIGPFLNGTLVRIVVWANNSMGEEFSRKFYEFIVTEDQMGPSIHISEVKPPTPQALEPVEITVHVVDDRPQIDVRNVTIHYRINGGKWEMLALSQINGNLFNITIGPFPGDSTVEFYFTAYDFFGNSGVTDVMTFEIPQEQRTIGSFEGFIAIIALVSWLYGRHFVSSRQNPKTKK